MPGFASPEASPEPVWGEPRSVIVSDELRELCAHPLLARLLAARGFATRAEALAFLDPSYRAAMDPLEVPGVDAAVERLGLAAGRGESVLVWGDFDADGQTATALLVLALRRVGLEPAWYVPDRVAESHGLSRNVFAEAVRHRAGLVVTCDCATGDLAQIEALAHAGVDTIVTDHHPWAGLAEGRPHPARALVTPRRLASDHPATHLSGVGAAYVLAAELLASRGLAADDLLDLVALGTIADVAPLIGENRHLAQRGLPRLNGGRRLGIRALLEVAGRRPSASRDAELAGWVLAPRLNAFGRLARADRGVRLLLTEDPDEARELAAEANALNLERQRLCDQVVAMTRGWVESVLGDDLPELGEDGQPAPLPSGPNGLAESSLFLADPSWHPGIVGLAASRLAEAYRRPVALAAIGAESARVSMRSGAPWADLSRAIAAIEAEAELGFRGGGHRGAAGGSLPAARLGDLGRVFARAMAAQAPPEPLARRLTVDAELSLAELTQDACAALTRLHPFGPGNPPPTLLVRGLRTTEPPRPLGPSGRHFKLSLVDDGGVYASAVWWDVAAARLPRERFDALAEIERSEFNGGAEVRLVVRAVRPAEPPPARPLEGIPLQEALL
jgi:single-stranded-DNA-specific exonuclease